MGARAADPDTLIASAKANLAEPAIYDRPRRLMVGTLSLSSSCDATSD
jgi:hypothetical protein